MNAPEYITIPLSKTGKHKDKYVAIVDTDDAILAEANWFVLLVKNSQYALRVIYNSSKKYIYLHREVMKRKLERELLPTEQVDHIDGNGLNNRRENLRIATNTQNNYNKGISNRNTSGYKGVSWHKIARKWRAQIKVDSKYHYLGLFKNPEDAYKAYCEAAKELHREFARYE